MGRERISRAFSATPAADRHKLTSSNKPAYKVVLEQVTQQKKKLVVLGSSQPKPPAGYTFIPAGDPQITSRCKHLARLDGAKVYIVSTTKHQHNNLSNQIHRIGYHFPSSIVARACLSLGIDLSRDGRVLHHQIDLTAAQPMRKGGGKKRKQPTITNPNADVSQAAIDTQAREAIKDLFPKIPSKDLHQIVKHAFELGTGRVGEAPELPLVRRVQLAVIAHIRHNYTDYDKLLRRIPYHAARASIEEASLNKLVEWRGDDDEEPNAMEEILREVIVIPDDEEEADDHSSIKDVSMRGSSVEIISSRAIETDVETRQIDYAATRSLGTELDTPDSDDDHEVTFLGHGQYLLDRHNEKRNNRNGAHRLRAWEEARDRFRQPDLRTVAANSGPSSTFRNDAMNHGDGTNHRQLNAQQQPLEDPPNAQRPHYASRQSQILASDMNGPRSTHNIESVHGRPDFYDTPQAFSKEMYDSQGPPSHKAPDSDPRGLVRMAQNQQNRVEPMSLSRVSTLYLSPVLNERPRLLQSDSRSGQTEDPLRFESIAQSIESPNHSNSANGYTNRLAYTIPSPHLNRTRVVGGPETHEFINTQQDYQQATQFVKRRRLNEGELPSPSHREELLDPQRGTLIARDSSYRHDEYMSRPVFMHSITKNEPTLRAEPTPGDRSAQGLVHMEYRDANRSESYRMRSGGGISFGFDSPRHRQIFLSPPQQPSHTMPTSVPVKLTPDRPGPGPPRHGSVQSTSYGLTAPYLSLNREIPHSSDVVVNGPGHRVISGSSYVNETNELVSANSSHRIGHWIERKDSPHFQQSYTSEPQNGRVIETQTPLGEADRSRRYLPLEHPYQELRPVRYPAPAGGIIGLRPQTTYPVIHHSSTNTEVKYDSCFTSPREAAQGSDSRYTIQSGNDRVMHLPSMEDNRSIAISEYKHQGLPQPRNPEPRGTKVLYQQPIRAPPPGHRPRRIFDTHTGEELIELD